MIVLPFLFFLFAFFSSLWIALDCATNKIPLNNKPYHWSNGAIVWFFAANLIWIIVFPHYLMKRTIILQERQAVGDALKSVPSIIQRVEALKENLKN